MRRDTGPAPFPRSAAAGAFAACLLALAPAANADEPLPLDKAVQVSAPGGAYRAIATPDPARITIVETHEPEAALWSFETYRRDPMLSEDGRTLLLPPRSGSLLDTDDPDQTVLTLVRAPGILLRWIRLGDVIGRDDLQRTASHWRWMDRIAWHDGAWTLTRPDGSALRIGVDGTIGARP